MVRVKERYLLVNILYPPEANGNVPESVVQHRPTTERVTPPMLLKAIKAEVALMFGDYGAGAFEMNLSGTCQVSVV